MNLADSGGESSLVLDKSVPAKPRIIYVITILSALGGFLFGYDTGVVSGAMILIRDYFELNYIMQEVVVSITVAAAWLFALFAGWLTDSFGRKIVIIVASFVFTVGAVLMGVATNTAMLISGRLIVGAGIGLASMTVPMYIAEVAPSDIRGTLVTVNNCCITAGQFIASVIDGAFSTNRDTGWRYMLGLAGIPSVIQFFGFLAMPESPRWLIGKGRYDEAAEVLRRVRGSSANIEEEFESIRTNCLDIEREKQERGENSPVIVQIFRSVSLRRALLVGCMLQAIQQLAGINTVMYYSASIIEMSGVKDKSKVIWLSSATAAVNCICSLIGLYFVERVGRRKLTLGSLIGVILSLSFLAIGFQLAATDAPNLDYHDPSANGTVCSTYSNCAPCVNDKGCGYCFDDLPSGPVNGTCLQANPDYPERSLYGMCNFTSSSPHDPDLIYAYQWCPSHFSWMTFVGLMAYLVCFAPGMGPMPWTVNAEIYPLWARSTCYSIATSVNWFFNFAVSLSFLTLTQTLTKYGAFWLYACLAFLGLVFLFFMLPETKGKSLEEVEGLFSHPWWKDATTSAERKTVQQYENHQYSFANVKPTNYKSVNSLNGGST